MRGPGLQFGDTSCCDHLLISNPYLRSGPRRVPSIVAGNTMVAELPASAGSVRIDPHTLQVGDGGHWHGL